MASSDDASLLLSTSTASASSPSTTNSNTAVRIAPIRIGNVGARGLLSALSDLASSISGSSHSSSNNNSSRQQRSADSLRQELGDSICTEVDYDSGRGFGASLWCRLICSLLLHFRLLCHLQAEVLVIACAAASQWLRAGRNWPGAACACACSNREWQWMYKQIWGVRAEFSI